MANQWRVITHKNKLPDLAAAALPFAREAVDRHAHEIESRAKVQAPVDTGYLRNSIHTKITNGGLTGIVHAAAEYAAYVEFGTRHQRAQPYMTPAFRAVEPKFVKVWRELFRKYG